MHEENRDRREFLKRAAAGSAAAVGAGLPATAEAQPRPAAPPANPGYAFLNLAEQAFIEAVVDHMVPADELSPKGTDIGINIFIDRALAGGWGKGERLYMQGPWKRGLPTQGYQLPLTPAELYRAGIAAANAYCTKTYGRPFDRLAEAQKQAFLLALQSGKVAFENGPPARTFFNMLYQNVMEGMFSDPIYGGNRDKAGWKLIGFPGVVAVHAQNVERYLDRRYEAPILGISDMS